MKRFVIGALIACALPQALAETRPAATRPYLKPEQILQCLRDRNEVDALGLDMTREKIGLDTEAAALQQEQFELESDGKELVQRIYQENQKANQAPTVVTDSGDPRLDRYLRQYAGANGIRRKHNKAVSAQQQKLHAHNARIDNYNLRLAGLRQRTQIIDRHCTGVPVRPADLAAARATLEAEKAAQTLVR